MNMHPIPILESAHPAFDGNTQKQIFLTYDLWTPLSVQLGFAPESGDTSSAADRARKRYFALCRALDGTVFTKGAVDQFISGLKSSNLLSHEQINHYIELIRAVAKYYNLSDLQEYPFLLGKSSTSIAAPRTKKTRSKIITPPRLKNKKSPLMRNDHLTKREMLKASPHAGNIEGFKNFLIQGQRASSTITTYITCLKQAIRYVPNLAVEEIYAYLGSLYDKGRQRRRIKIIVESIRLYGRYIGDKHLKTMTYLNEDGSKSAGTLLSLVGDSELPLDLRAALKKFKNRSLRESRRSVDRSIICIYKLYSTLHTLAPQTVQQYVTELSQQGKSQGELDEIIKSYRAFGAFLGIKDYTEVGKVEQGQTQMTKQERMLKRKKALEDLGFTVIVSKELENGHFSYEIIDG